MTISEVLSSLNSCHYLIAKRNALDKLSIVLPICLYSEIGKP